MELSGLPQFLTLQRPTSWDYLASSNSNIFNRFLRLIPCGAKDGRVTSIKNEPPRRLHFFPETRDRPARTREQRPPSMTSQLQIEPANTFVFLGQRMRQVPLIKTITRSAITRAGRVFHLYPGT